MTFDQILRPITGKRRFRFAVMDIESTNWTKLKMIGFYDGDEYVWFKTTKEFLEHFLTKKYLGWRCFAHNGGNFDFMFLFDDLSKHYPDLHYEILSNNGASMIRIRNRNRKSWYFLDSFRLLPKSQAELTRSFDVEHKKMDVDRGNIGRLSWDELIKYNEYDCRGLYEVLKKFEHWFDEFSIPLKPTTASQAMSVFRKTLKFGIPVLKPEVEDFILRGYHGGRTEVFKMRCQEKFFYYDVRSLYPYCMKKYPMPVGTPRESTKIEDDSIGFYSATINVPDVYLPPLPFVTRQKLIFPTGKFSGVYSSLELGMAQDMGCDVDIHYGYVFPDSYIFDEYVDKMYAYKESKDDVTRFIGKLLLNSCYGKFGQNRNKTTMVHAVGDEQFGLIPYDLNYNLFQKETRSRATFIIPSISAWITSCARFELYNWLRKAGDSDVYYCDTDSVLSTRRLPTGDGLGKLKLEMEGDEGIFLSPKMYVIKQGDKLVTRAKGFEHEFVNNLSFKSFEKALYGDRSDFVQEVRRFAKFKEALVREGKFVTMLTKKKSIQSDYSKRKVLANFDTKPLDVSC